MIPFSKKNRSAIACNTCRTRRVRCVMEGNSRICKRCKAIDISCEFEIKPSQQVGLIRKRIMDTHHMALANTEKRDTPPNHLNVIFPKKQHVIELAEIFFANQYQGIFPFIHRPSFFRFLNSDEFNPATYIEDYNSKFFRENYASNLQSPDPILLLSMLALCARLHNQISFAYGKFLEDDSPETFSPTFSDSDQINDSGDTDLVLASNASKYFGWHARRYMKEVFDSPTLQRIQAFTLLSSHEWGEGNNSRSFLYVGIAARMALVLGLGNESSICSPEDEVEDESMKHIILESKRRTIWSVYMMDRCNSSGRERSPAIRIEDINVRLPSHENDFIFGNLESSLSYNDFNSLLKKQSLGNNSEIVSEMKKIPILGFTIILFEIWAKIAKWVGEVGVKYEKTSPWISTSTFNSLTKSLDNLAEVLPQKYKYTEFNLKMHTELGTATHFGYFHGLYFLCRIFLNREYLFCNPNSFPENWWSNITVRLLTSLENISSLISELKLKNMMVIAPFTGFEVYTSAITSLYFCSFPNEILLENLPRELISKEHTLESLDQWKVKYKNMALRNLEALGIWTHAWELGRKWHQLSLNLGIVFGQLAESGNNEIDPDDLRHSMQDYGCGKVSEVYIPQKSNKDHLKNTSPVLDMIENKDSKRQNIPFESELGAIEFLSPPQLSLFTNTPSIYPGWNGVESDATRIIS